MKRTALTILFLIVSASAAFAGTSASLPIDGSGNYGIGSTAPQAKLDVEGNVYFGNGNIGVGSNTPTQKVDVIGTVKAVRFVGDGSGITGIGGTISGLTAGYHTKATASNTVGNSIVYDNGTNVGIGTSVPRSALDIVGAGTTSATLSLVIRDSAKAARVTVWDNGNVGVGTTNPIRLLEAYGGVKLLGGSYAGYLDVYPNNGADSAGGINLLGGTNNNGYEGGTIQVAGGWNAWGGGFVNIWGGNTPSATQGGNVYIQGGDSASGIDGNVILAGDRGNIGIGSSVPQAKLDVEGSVYVGNGNVGVGSSVPVQRVEVVGTVKATAFIGDGSGITGLSGTISGLTSGYLTKATSGTTIGNSLVYDNGTNVGIGTSTPAGKFVVYGGNVGLGSTAPAMPLDVGGSLASDIVKVQNTNTSGGSSIAFYDSSGNYKGDIGYGNTSSTQPGPLQLSIGSMAGVPVVIWTDDNGSGSAVERLRIQNSSGNVGINSSVPQAKLDVEGNVYFGNGNVGIGSANPNQKFVVAGGNVVISNSAATLTVGSGTGNGTVYAASYSATGTSGYDFATQNSGKWYMNNNYSELTAQGSTSGLKLTGTNGITFTTDQDRMKIAATGNVGINSSVPQAKLDVEGSVYFGNGNIGAGTSAPVQKIEVVGTVKATAFIGDGSGLTGLPSGGGWSRSGTNVYVTTSSDNVGIGTSVPLSKLDLIGGGTTSATKSLVIRDATKTARLTILDSGNVGLGSSNPERDLVIRGNAAADVGAIVTNASADGFATFTFINDNTVGGQVGMGGTNQGTSMKGRAYFYSGGGALGVSVIGSDASADIRLYTAGLADANERMRVTPAGNVGINSTVPQARLDVEGSAYFGNGNIGVGSSAPSQKIDVIGTVKATAFIGDGSGLTGLPSGGGWSRSGTNVYVTTSSDNVGIGTSVPLSKLDLVGSGTTSATASLIIRDSAKAAKLTMLDNGNIGIGITTPFTKFHVADLGDADGVQVYVENTAGMNGGVGGALGFRGKFSGAGAVANFATIKGVKENGSDTDYASAMTFGTRVDGGSITEKMRISSTGNVGIGTTAPGGRLLVYGGNVGVGSTVPSQAVDVIGTVKATAFIGDGSGLTGLPSGGGWSRSGTNVYVTTATDNVGIGTVSPYSTKFVVMGQGGQFAGTATAYHIAGFHQDYSNFRGIWLGHETSGYNGLIAAGANGANPNNLLFYGFNGAAWGEKMRLTGAGNFGIGSSVPQAKLDLVGSGTTSATTSLIIRDSTNAAAVTFLDNGNVGMGSTSPQDLLDIRKDQAAATSFRISNANAAGRMRFILSDGSANKGMFDFRRSDDAMFVTNVANGPIFLETNNTLRMTISNTGNVGIGSSVPQAKLDVEGSAYFGNGNIGVGSSVPSQKIDVLGTVKATAFIGDGSGLTGLPSGGGWTRTGTNVYVTTATDNVGVGTSVPLSKLDIVGAGTTTATKSLVIRDSNKAAMVVVADSGNVGVGSTSPAAQVHVFSPTGDSNILVESPYPTIRLKSSNANRTWLYQVASDGTFQWLDDTASTTPFKILQAAPTNSLVINGSGNIGVGTSVPLSKVDIVGTGTTSATTALVIRDSAKAPKVTVLDSGNVGIANSAPSNMLDIWFTFGGTAPLFIADKDDYTNATFGINNVGHLTYGPTFSTNAIPVKFGNDATIIQATGTFFEINPGSGTAGNLFSVRNHNVSMFMINGIGNVGINSSVPQAKLDVEGSAYFGNGNIGVGSSVPSQKVDVLGTVRATAFIGTTAQFTSASNVGIGSTAPRTKLDVVGTVTATAFVGDGSGLTGLPSGGGWSRSGSNVYTTNGSDNVGIGSSVPRAKLDVNGGILGTTVNKVTITAPAAGSTLTIADGKTLTANSSLTLAGTDSKTLTVNNSLTLAGADSKTLNIGSNSLTFSTSADSTITLPTTGTMVTTAVTSLPSLTGVSSGLTGMVKSASGTLSGVTGTGGMAARWTDTNTIGTGVIYDNGTNVGIGTSVPLGKLDVVGAGTTSATASLVIRDSTKAAKATFLDNGYVGLGSSSPQAALQVVTGIFDRILQLGNTNTPDYITMNNDGSMVFRASIGGSGGGTFFDFGNNSVGNLSGGYTYFGINPDNVADDAFVFNVKEANVSRLVVDGAGNVGINSIVPRAKLEVVGTVRATAFIGDGSGLTNLPAGGAGGWSDGGANVYLTTVGDNVGIGTSVPLSKLDLVGTGTTSATKSFVIRDSAKAAKVTVLDNGNVGIGSTLPQTGLDVYGSINVDVNAGHFRLSSGGTYRGSFGDQGTFTGIWGDGDGTTNNPAIAIKSGNTGLGTTVPRAKLDVEGSVYLGSGNVGINSSVPSQRVDVVGTVKATAFIGDGSGLTGIGASSWSANGSNVYLTTLSNNVGIGTSTPSGKLVVYGGNVGIGSTVPLARLELVGMGTTSATKTLSIRASNATEFLTVLDNGYVGIGEVAPAYPLDVTGTIIGTNYIIAGGNGGGFDGIFRAFNVGSVVKAQIHANGDSFLSGGNVGIGSSVPQAKLDVEGSAYFGNGNIGMGSSAPSQKIDVLGTVRATAFIGDGSGLTGLPSGGGWTRTGANVYVTTATDNVGIGTSAPVARFEINGGTGNSTLLSGTYRGTGASDQLVYTLTATESAGPSENGLLQLMANGVSQVYLTALASGNNYIISGNVGIGTSVPLSKLDLVGSGTTSATKALVIRDSAKAPKVTVLDNGNVGIGTTAPAYPFEVNSGSFGAIANFKAPSNGGYSVFSVSGEYGAAFLLNNVYTMYLNALTGTNTLGSSGAVVLSNNGTTSPVAQFGKSTTDRTSFFYDNVGINSSTPRAKLDVEGNVYFGDGGTAGSGNLGIGSAAPSQKVDVIGTVKATAFVGDGSGLTGLPSGGGWSRSGTNVYVTTSTDNVGIGTSAPRGKLEVAGATLFSSGNVGVGTSAPTSTLQIVSTGSLGLPQDSNPSVSVAGQIALDTTGPQLIYHDGTAARIVPDLLTKSTVIENPTDADNFLWFRAERAMTVTGIDCLVNAATSAVITVQECDGNGASCGATESAITCGTTNSTESGGIDDANIDSGDWVRIDVGTVTGAVGHVAVSLTYRENRL